MKFQLLNIVFLNLVASFCLASSGASIPDYLSSTNGANQRGIPVPNALYEEEVNDDSIESKKINEWMLQTDQKFREILMSMQNKIESLKKSDESYEQSLDKYKGMVSQILKITNSEDFQNWKFSLNEPQKQELNSLVSGYEDLNQRLQQIKNKNEYVALLDRQLKSYQTNGAIFGLTNTFGAFLRRNCMEMVPIFFPFLVVAVVLDIVFLPFTIPYDLLHNDTQSEEDSRSQRRSENRQRRRACREWNVVVFPY